MAENKKSFVAYGDWENQLDLLSDDEAGKLFRHLLAYVNGRKPEFSNEDRILKMAFEPIKQQLKRDLKKYEDTKEQNSVNGRLGNLKRYNKDLYNQVVNKKISLDEAELIAVRRKMSPPEVKTSPPDNPRPKNIANLADNDNVNDNVNDNDNDILLEKESKSDLQSEEVPKELFQDDKPPDPGQRKKVAPKKESDDVELIFPFDSNTFKAQWDLYKVFRKKKHRFTFLNNESENRKLTELFNLSNGDEKFAIKIIQNSIDNGYKGLFLPKNIQNGQTNNSKSNNGNNYQAGGTGSGSKISGKISGRSILAKEYDKHIARDSESGDFTFDAEIVE